MHETAEETRALFTERIPDLRKKFGIRKIGIFGSVAQGKASEESDVDVLVEFEEGQASFDHFMELIQYLEDLLGKRVDLVTTRGLSPYLRPSIEQEVIWCEG
ncbi:MAG TPA: nucleotidyltransferase family protein [Methanoregulaceae archaeon]|nr:nucleotidyltransferase family protein [Methanoregulaceae archaeon]